MEAYKSYWKLMEAIRRLWMHMGANKSSVEA